MASLDLKVFSIHLFMREVQFILSKTYHFDASLEIRLQTPRLQEL